MIRTSYYQDLSKLNTFGMKVKARCFMEYDSVADLVDIDFEELARPVLHIGGGSNLLQTEEIGTMRSFLQTIMNPRQDIPLIRRRVPLQEAMERYRADGQTDKARLLSWRPWDYFDEYAYEDFSDYYYGYEPDTVILEFNAGAILSEFTDYGYLD